MAGDNNYVGSIKRLPMKLCCLWAARMITTLKESMGSTTIFDRI
jgi:hypothetical protein